MATGSGEWIPTVSVCVPLYMKERFVARTIHSILAQTFDDFELVILHNASPDRSGEIAASFDDPRIRLIHNAETIPGPDNVIAVASLARGEFVKIVAADDMLHPTVLAKQVAVLRQHPEVAIVSCAQNMVGEHDELIAADRSLRTSDLVGLQNRTTVVRRVVRHSGNPIGAYVNLMYRRSAYEAAGGMPDVPWMAQDLALILEILKHGDYFGVPETLVDFRIASGSESAVNDESLDEQVDYIMDVRRDDREILRLRDLTHSSMRIPLMRIRHRILFSAAGRPDSIRTRTATRVLGFGRSAA